MPCTQPSERVVLQRIRNRILEYLETLASLDTQRVYAAQLPSVYLPYELINSWEDWVGAPRPRHFTSPVFSELERNAVESFYLEWDAAASALPEGSPPLEEVLAAPYWARLRDAATAALNVFMIRGRLSEDIESA